MSILVYITEECRQDANKHNFLPDVERFVARVEASQSIHLFDPFPPPFLVKKKLGGRQGRLIAELRPVMGHSVIVCLAVLTRGSREYEDEFAKDPHDYGRKHFAGLVEQGALDSFVRERTEVSPPAPKPAPSEAEYAFLYNAFSHHEVNSGSDEMVFETNRWVERVQEPRLSNQLSLIAHACLNALSVSPGLHKLTIPQKAGWGMWVYRSAGRLLLVSPFTDGDAEQTATYAAEVAARVQDQGDRGIVRESRRAYPALVLADDELWIQLEKDPLGNMALSPEESEVLQRARKSQEAFPLFINGRAGSGKSTILQYLFSDLLFYYLTDAGARTIGPPLYLTANPELLRTARQFVAKLIKSEATFAQLGGNVMPEDSQASLNEAFQVFQPYLLSLVPAEERTRRFPESGRVDYSRFRRLWFERFGKNKRALQRYSADLSWHVIRSYIKGMSSETYLEPDDYVHIPENQVTVTHEAFKEVFDTVFSNWYQPTLTEHKWWDDQDLARYILDNELAQPMHPAVFCDEAQDFTRIELELLLRLNLYSDRSVPPSDIDRVPFAFAGDQFQTLNPTGFRWDSIKAAFVEKFIFELDPSRRFGPTELNYCELKFNYRSTERIVRFCNLVQAVRAAYFGIPDLRPQVSWLTHSSSFGVIWFRADDLEFWTEFRKQPGYVVIVPCNEGEEADYVAGDRWLREHIRVEDGVPVNVLSASRAKGREYPAVLVYGFGANSPSDICASLANYAGVSNHPDESLPIQYFINKLYVAVSRPKRRLIVVDSDDGLRKLWQSAVDSTAERLILKSIKNGEQIWTDQVEGMRLGKPEELGLDFEANPIENAEAFEQDGLTRKDAFLLLQAAQAYRSAGLPTKAKACSARAQEFEGRLLQAGASYMEAGLVNDATRCLWNAGKPGWKQLVATGEVNSDAKRSIQYQLASALVTKLRTEEAVEVLATYARQLDDPDLAETSVVEPGWASAVSEILSELVDKRGAMNKRDALVLAPSLSKFQSKGIQIPARPAAEVFYAAGKLTEAIAYWEGAGELKSANYLEAKSSIEPYPAKVLTLAKAGKYQAIVDSYRASAGVLLNGEQITAVVTALLRTQAHQEAADLALQAKHAVLVAECAAVSFKKGHKDQALRYVNVAVSLMVAQGHWEHVLTLLSGGTFAPTVSWKDPALRNWIRTAAGDIKIATIRSLARSTQLSDALPHVQRHFSDVLRDFLRIKDGAWRKSLSIQEAGAAHERAGRFTDAVAFYEAVQGDKDVTPLDRQFARERWVVCKQRQLQHERTQGSSDKAKKVAQELDKRRKEWRLNLPESYPEFPDLADVAVPESNASGLRTGVATPASDPASTNGNVDTKSSKDVPQLSASITAELKQLALSAEHSPSSNAPDTLAPVPLVIPTVSSEKPGTPMPEPAALVHVTRSASTDADEELERGIHEVMARNWPERVALSIGVIELELSRRNLRCNLTHQETRDTATIKLKERKCASVDVEFLGEGNLWMCEQWDEFTVSFPETHRGEVELGFPKLGLTLTLSFAE